MNNQMNINQPVYNQPVNSNKNNKNKIFIFGGIILTVFIAIITLIVVNSGSKEDDTTSNDSLLTQGNLDRTIMIYMVGSNLESEGGMASLDIKEIEKANINLDDVNILVYAGGSNSWKNGFSNNTIYELTSTGFSMVKEDVKSNMGEPATLTRFLEYGKDNYESDAYSLILWNHGAGPILGYGADEVYNNDNLFLSELDTAIKNSGFSESNKLEFIGFDACLMASAEVANTLSDYTNYMVASQDLEPGYGWDYSFLSNVNKNTTTEELGKYIIDQTDSYYKNLNSKYGGKYTFSLTLSLLDLTKIDELETDLNNLFTQVDTTLTNNGYSSIVSNITKAKSFGYDGIDKSYDLIDLYGVATELDDLYSEKATKLKSSIEDVVVYQKSNVEGANGISIYYPYYTKSLITQFLKIYKGLDFANEYTLFLDNYSRILTGSRLYDYDLKRVTPEFSNDNETLSVTLSDDVVAGYNAANYKIFRDMKNGYYMPVYKSSDVTLKGNILSANFNKKQLAITDSKGDTGWATMFEYEKTDKYTIYNIPVILQKTSGDISEFKSDNAYIRLKVDKKNPSGKIMGFVPFSDVNDSSSNKKIINIEEWDYIQFFNSEYDFFDDNGNYTDDWKSSGTYYITEVKVDDYELEFIDLDDGYDYYCLFTIADTQGNEYNTNLIKVK